MKTIVLLALCFLALPAHAVDKIAIVTAENFYGDIAQQIGGDAVTVTSILDNPDQDPHLFEADASVARALSNAAIVVYNGVDYDPWMEKLLGAARNAKRKTIVVAALTGHKPGDNPHVWYDPKTISAYAQSLGDALIAADPAHKSDYQNHLLRFLASLQPIQTEISTLHDRLAGKPVTATEPVFGYMLDALGLVVRNGSFQLAVMNNTEPSASDIAAFENDLKNHKVQVLIYNSQASDPIAVRMGKLAEAAGIPIVGATETEPNGYDYQHWVMGELNAIDQALPE